MGAHPTRNMPSPLHINFLASETSFISASSIVLRSNHNLPSGVARNLRACIFRLLRFVAACELAFDMLSPPLNMPAFNVQQRDSTTKVTMVQIIDDHYVPCWAHKKRRRVALPQGVIPSQGG